MGKGSAKKTPTSGSKPRSPSGAKGAGKYNYEELNKCSLTSANPCHFYGIIVDATFPYKVHADRFICTLKVIDPTLYGNGKSAQVVIYAKRFEDLPIVHRLGDIIRVHRANLRMYKNSRQFNVNVYYKSSWALYSTDKQTPLGLPSGDGPYAFSGNKATQERQDKAIFQTLFKWTNGIFAQQMVGDSNVTALKNASKASGDFDVVAKILQVFELDEYTNELKLRDGSGEVFYTLALKLKFPHLRQGAVVRIRSASFDETSLNKKVLVLQHYSNIMTFLSSSKLATTVSKVTNDTAGEKAALKRNDTSMLPVVLTEVDKKHQGLASTSLHDLFHTPDMTKSTFRTCFYVTKVEPSNAAESVQAYDRKTKKTSSAKGKGGSDLIYKMQFLVKDVSTQFNNNVYRVLLYTHEGLGSNFLAKPANLHSEKGALKRLEDSTALLTRFNSWVDAVVERRNGYYFIKDTKMVF